MPKPTAKSNSTSALPKEVAEVFEIPEGQLPQFSCAEFGNVDLTIITLEFAERLAEKGYLKKLQ